MTLTIISRTGSLGLFKDEIGAFQPVIGQSRFLVVTKTLAVG
jgi:hypothetical protein